MRYAEQAGQPQKEEKPKKEEPRILAGSKDFDYNDLGEGKKIPTKDGWK